MIQEKLRFKEEDEPMKMKKMTALLLAAVMLFGCALAEPEGVVTYSDGA